MSRTVSTAFLPFIIFTILQAAGPIVGHSRGCPDAQPLPSALLPLALAMYLDCLILYFLFNGRPLPVVMIIFSCLIDNSIHTTSALKESTCTISVFGQSHRFSYQSNLYTFHYGKVRSVVLLQLPLRSP